MRVLFLSPYVPYPVVHGGRNWTSGLIRVLARFATVRVLAIGDPHARDVSESAARLSALGVRLDVFAPTGPGPAEVDPDDVRRPPDALAHFRCPGLHVALPRVLREFAPDVVHLEELVMAQYASAVPRPRVAGRQKVEWAFLQAMAKAPACEVDAREAARFRRLETEAVTLYDHLLVVGEEDRKTLSPLYGAERIDVIPIPVEDGIRRPDDRTREVRHVLLYGTVDYGPNVEANERYLREVWPALSRALPDVHTRVVGSGTPPPSLRADVPRVEVRGYVEDIASELAGPGVLVVPLRVGGGARTKVLEALAAGMPVVSTAVGVESLGLEPGRHYLAAGTAAEMIEAVRRLAGDPELVARLGLEGARHVDRLHRVEVIAPKVEGVYRALASARGAVPAGRDVGPHAMVEPLHVGDANPARRVLLIGCGPLPGEVDAVSLSFAGHRTAQFTAALQAAGCEIESIRLTGESRFRPPSDLQRIHDAFSPAAVISAGGYHPARVTIQLETDRPRFIDLAGDLAAEAQLRAAREGDGVLADYLTVLSRALALGDHFSVVGPTQRLVVLGQLGTAGRLSGGRVGEDPVAVVPLAAEGPASAPSLPPGGLRLLWSGGYNTWMDEETLFAGVMRAMTEHPEVVFVSTGGPIADHDEETHRRFWDRVRGSAFADRFEDHGRVPRRRALAILGGCHVVLSVSRDCFEAEFGSRQRLVEGLAHGRPAITTAPGDLSAAIADAGAGLVVPATDPGALAAAIGTLATDRDRLTASAASARCLWERRFTYRATTAPLEHWLREPRPWPASAIDGDSLRALADDHLRMAAELDAIRGSYTFRALRLVDRLLGRPRGKTR